MGFTRIARRDFAHMVATAEHFISNIIFSGCIANYDLSALSNHDAINRSSIMSCALATPT
jgi:hypothetical protein